MLKIRNIVNESTVMSYTINGELTGQKAFHFHFLVKLIKVVIH